jgi:hypothetical protein
MFLVFTKQRGLWKFHAFLSSNDQLKLETDHLNNIGMESKVLPVTNFDLSQIKAKEEILNDS